MNGRLYAKDGLLWIDGVALTVHQADAAARSAGLPYAEMLVKRLEWDRDAFIAEYRDWLIDLGWTPPPLTKGQPEAINRVNELPN